MRFGRFIEDVRVASANQTTGAKTTHTFALETVTPIEESFFFVVIYPSEVKLPVQAVTCSGGGALSD
jgi:hypothetical protein